MAATIKIKNSSTTGAVPTSSDLVQGELAVNVTDLGLYTENASGTVVKLNAPSIDDKNTGATKYLTISTGGNLGLGVTPSTFSGGKAIEIGAAGNAFNGYEASNILISSGAYYNSGWKYANSSYGASVYQQYRGSHNWQIAASGTAGNAITFTTAMTLDASGRLLLGATSALGTENLRIGTGSGSTGTLTYFDAGSNGNSVIGRMSGSNTWFLGDTYAAIGSGTGMINYVYGANPWIVYTNATERARIDSSGNLLVGATSGSSKLTVSTTTQAAAIRCENSRNVSGDFSFVTTLGSNCNNTSSYHIICATGGNDRFYVLGNGNVQNINNSYGAISDIKLKENITDATPKLADLMQVQVRNYNLIGDTTKQIGVVAQELESVFPSLVEETADRDAEGNDLGTTTKSVKYSVFVPMLIKAIQEQQAIIETLTNRISALEAK